jgi:hypothetical protein
MVDKVKKYVEYELNNISKGFDGSLALERAYGATSFVLYCEWDEELSEWWDEILPKFLEATAKQERRKSKAWKKEKSTV